MIQMGKDNDCKVAALLGTAQHAINQVKAGVDILVVSGTEAGGHCGSVSTMVLIPEVHQAIQPYGDVPILAAGGIVTGKQMAAAMAMGASGAWCGSVWLTTIESEVDPIVKEKMVAANSKLKKSLAPFTKDFRSNLIGFDRVAEQLGEEISKIK